MAWEDAKVPDNSEDAYLVAYHWHDFGDALGVDPAGKVPAKSSRRTRSRQAAACASTATACLFLAPNSDGHEPS